MTEAPTIGIGRLLKEGGRFLIPHHQRDYSWTEDQLEQLFIDISDAQKTNQSEYFIGLMVFMPDGDREFTILDGQQRLATTIIILAAVRTWLRARGVSDDANQIQEHYIATRELGSDVWEPILVLNESNNDAFVRHVVAESPIEDIESELQGLKRYDPNRRLLEAILYCRKYVNEIGASAQDKAQGAELLFDMVRYLRDNVKVVRLNVPNEANAYTVFETLNDRGLDLSVLDLVKNHLFGRADGEIALRDMQGRWSQMTANLTTVRADDFVKAWWTSRHGRIQNPQLFARFKGYVSSWTKAQEVSRDLLPTSEKYAALEVADDPLWRQYSEKTRQRVSNLKLLGGQQVHPVLLSALDRFPPREMERLLRLLEILIVRYQLVGGGRTGRLEISCARLANQIYERKCSTATEASRLLKDIFPNDDQFRDNFKTKQERNSQKARYLLNGLQQQAMRSQWAAVLANELEPSSSLTLEHVFPRNPGNNWQSLRKTDPEFADDYTYRLGNLCLLTDVNRALGNKEFADKMKIFANSKLSLTQEIAGYSRWDRQAVDRRQAQMARLAITHWRFN